MNRRVQSGVGRESREVSRKAAIGTVDERRVRPAHARRGF